MKFSDIFIDDTKNVKKINSDEYLEKGKIAVIDQGKELIAGYTSDSVDNICSNHVRQRAWLVADACMSGTFTSFVVTGQKNGLVDRFK